MKKAMNRKMKLLSFGMAGLGVLAIPAAVAVACGSSTSGQTVSYANAPTYTYAGPDMSAKSLYAIVSDPENPRWQKAAADLRTAASEAKFQSATVDIQKSQNQQDTTLNANVGKNGYILGATEASGFANAINQINTGNQAPIVAYDRLLKVVSANYNWYVTFDSKQVGRLQGLSIINALYGSNFTAASTTNAEITTAVNAKKLTATKTVMILAGDPADNNAQLFFNGAKEVIDTAIAADTNLKQVGSWTFSQVAQANWDYNAGRAYLQTAINALPAADKAALAAVVSPNDGMAVSVTAALQATNVDPKNVWITGLDSNDSAILAIANDTGQDMTVFKPDYGLARVAIAVVAQLIAKANSTVDEVKNAITTTYPKLADFGAITVDSSGNDYFVGEGSSKKTINTVLLNPVLITKANWETYFKIS